jgi:hypothetical protein
MGASCYENESESEFECLLRVTVKPPIETSLAIRTSGMFLRALCKRGALFRNSLSFVLFVRMMKLDSTAQLPGAVRHYS